jgi:hypothetical protein
VALFDLRLLPPELRNYRVASTHSLTITDGIEFLAVLVGLVLVVSGLIGLWRGTRSGRLLCLASCLLVIALSSFNHPVVASALSGGLGALSSLIAGAILGFAFSGHTSSTNAT